MILYDNEQKAYNKLIDYIKIKNYSSIFVLCDTNTIDDCYNIFDEKINNLINIKDVIVIKAGEQFKTLEACENIWNRLLIKNADRNSLLINLGGGVVSDIGGFAASIYKRGINYINIPTTLLSMVDACVGGKTGVDFNSAKNILGTFTMPQVSLIDTLYLRTLNHIEILNGFAEMLKHGLISDYDYWTDLSIINLNNIGYEQIKKSIEIKTNIVDKDFTEYGIRKILNFGHTIGHGIESSFIECNYDKALKHGEAIAIGMIIESYISVKLGYLQKNKFEEIKNFIINVFGCKDIEELTYMSIINYINNDKKNFNKKLLFVLLTDIGKAIYDIEVNDKLIVDALKYYSSLITKGHNKL